MRRGASGINALVAIDKPCGMTSHDVVACVRRICRERRVGHAGTLDPDASGVLVVGIGQATRLMGLLACDRKGYDARICWGTQTSTDDAEGEVVRTAEVPDWVGDPERAAECVRGLVGPESQVPPAYSAISINGVRSYARARAGQAVRLEPRPVEVYDARRLGVAREGGSVVWTCSLLVSKGCYIRAIARDLGLSSGSAAHLCGLRRTLSGSVGIDACAPLCVTEALGPELASRYAIDPASSLGLPVRRVDGDEAGRAASGQALALGSVARLVAEGGRASLVMGTRLLGVWRRRGDSLVSDVNLPAGVEGVRA